MPLMYCRKSQTFYSCVLRWSFILFLCTNALLFYYLYEQNESICLNEGFCKSDGKSVNLSKQKLNQNLYFKVLIENFRQVGYEWKLTYPFNYSTYMNELNCSSLHGIRDLKFIAAGWTKSAYKININHKIITMKVINIEGRDVSLCMLEKNKYDCYLTAASKLLQEILLLRKISHPNIIKVLGYCVPLEPSFEDIHHTVTIFEEYGEPINVIKMLQLTWEDRLKISLGLSRLLKHLASFKEPIALNDFRRQQFVVIEGELKLIDVDDVGLQEQKCNNAPCCFSVSTISTKMRCLPCVSNICLGYNEKMNILKAGTHFIQHILPHGVPVNLNAVTLKITSAFELASLSSDDILKEMENLVTSFKNGWYRNNSFNFLSGFKIYSQKDLSSNFDYRCKLTAFSYGCMMSVSSSEEAAEACVRDLECKAFVITNIITWTGRRIALFKNGIGNFIDNNATTLFVKQ